ncbi:MAG: UTP--glucose-1-phosphate uridylyltransferase GalU [Oscillospiraceae bacterium]|nr:UTP--glucose-1-phosphate uridylyltransferase GalU [Oscillospiraceae bacterium]
MKVKKAVIPAAGLGTRMLPATKAIPKELLPLLDKPVLQYIVEEAVAAGIEDILIITNRGKSAMEDYFDYVPDLQERLAADGKAELLAQVKNPADMANFYFLRQKETKGLGHAIWRAKSFVGDEPFAVLLGDDVMRAEVSVTRQLIDAAEKYGASCVGIKEVSDEAVAKYCSVEITALEERIYRVTDMVEKPVPEEKFSNFAILGRYVLSPGIFPILETLPPGRGGEIQLTDGLQRLCQVEPMVAKDFEGKRYDTGNLVGFLEATLAFALDHPETGAWLKGQLAMNR